MSNPTIEIRRLNRKIDRCHYFIRLYGEGSELASIYAEAIVRHERRITKLAEARIRELGVRS